MKKINRMTLSTSKDFSAAYPTNISQPDAAPPLVSLALKPTFLSLSDMRQKTTKPSTTFDEPELDTLQGDLSKESPALIEEMLVYFPDLPTFIIHSKFPVFSNLWIDFQKQILLAQYPENRWEVQSWMKLSIEHIGFMMIVVVKSCVHSDMDLEIVSRSMFSAFRQLRDHIDLVHDLFQIIENGRVWFNENPLTAIAPLVESLIQQKKNEGGDKKVETLYANSRSFLKSNQASIDILQSTIHGNDCNLADLQGRENAEKGLFNQKSMDAMKNPGLDVASLSRLGREKKALFSSRPISPDVNEQLIPDGSHPGSKASRLFPNHPAPSFSANTEYTGLEENDPEQGLARKRQKKRVDQEPKQSSLRRTATSYDGKTTHLLKSIFYEIYSAQSRLTKEQRKYIENQTGLKPRNITYWFSNHKRRFQHALEEFKKTVQESQGQVKNYGDFLNWQKKKKKKKKGLEKDQIK